MISKPVRAHAKVLQQLFPSSSAKRPKLSGVFDPSRPCVAAEQQRKKKAARSKPSIITVVLTEDKRRVVPKGKHRTALNDSGRIKKAEFTRAMSPEDVMKTLRAVFPGLSEPIFLECEVGNTQCLVEADNQQLDGNELISSAHKRKGSVYIVEGHVKVSEKAATNPESSDDDLPIFDLTGNVSTIIYWLIMIPAILNYVCNTLGIDVQCNEDISPS